MPEIIHFRGADQIIEEKGLDADVRIMLQYVEDVLYGSLYKREITNVALDDCNWRDSDLIILPGRRYQYKGFKKGIALEGNFSAYEYILEGLFRLQLGFDQGRIDAGILMLNGQRSGKSRLGTSADLAKIEVEQLYPTISMPLTIALFDLGLPHIPGEDANEGGEGLGISIPTVKPKIKLKENDPEFTDPYP